jgi:hypothetical protein
MGEKFRQVASSPATPLDELRILETRAGWLLNEAVRAGRGIVGVHLPPEFTSDYGAANAAGQGILRIGPKNAADDPEHGAGIVRRCLWHYAVWLLARAQPAHFGGEARELPGTFKELEAKVAFGFGSAWAAVCADSCALLAGEAIWTSPPPSPRLFEHAPDFARVWWQGQPYEVNRKQQQLLLRTLFANGGEPMEWDRLRSAIGAADSAKLGDVLKGKGGRPAWVGGILLIQSKRPTRIGFRPEIVADIRRGMDSP